MAGEQRWPRAGVLSLSLGPLWAGGPPIFSLSRLQSRLVSRDRRGAFSASFYLRLLGRAARPPPSRAPRRLTLRGCRSRRGSARGRRDGLAPGNRNCTAGARANPLPAYCATSRPPPHAAANAVATACRGCPLPAYRRHGRCRELRPRPRRAGRLGCGAMAAAAVVAGAVGRLRPAAGARSPSCRGDRARPDGDGGGWGQVRGPRGRGPGGAPPAVGRGSPGRRVSGERCPGAGGLNKREGKWRVALLRGVPQGHLLLPGRERERAVAVVRKGGSGGRQAPPPLSRGYSRRLLAFSSGNAKTQREQAGDSSLSASKASCL